VDHLQANQKAWNQFAESGSLFAKTATDAECRNPLKTLDGRGWLPDSVAGLNVLCLAAGGGWQSVLYAAAGARVTVVDISDSMLKLDEQECRRRGFPVRTIQASMDELGILADEKLLALSVMMEFIFPSTNNPSACRSATEMNVSSLSSVSNTSTKVLCHSKQTMPTENQVRPNTCTGWSN
jgi:hypothetical protein